MASGREEDCVCWDIIKYDDGSIGMQKMLDCGSRLCKMKRGLLAPGAIEEED